jgi:hypothetical protein
MATSIYQWTGGGYGPLPTPFQSVQSSVHDYVGYPVGQRAGHRFAPAMQTPESDDDYVLSEMMARRAEQQQTVLRAGSRNYMYVPYENTSSGRVADGTTANVSLQTQYYPVVRSGDYVETDNMVLQLFTDGGQITPVHAPQQGATYGALPMYSAFD